MDDDPVDSETIHLFITLRDFPLTQDVAKKFRINQLTDYEEEVLVRDFSVKPF